MWTPRFTGGSERLAGANCKRGNEVKRILHPLTYTGVYPNES